MIALFEISRTTRDIGPLVCRLFPSFMFLRVLLDVETGDQFGLDTHTAEKRNHFFMKM